MKEKKGFTLIELLAVIVILAIIALIATPLILGVIETARKGAAQSSTHGYIKAIENKVASSLLKNEKYEDKEDYVYDEIEVDIKGDVPTGGMYSLKDGIVTSGVFCINGYEVTYLDNKTEVQRKCTGEDLKLSGSVKISETSGFYTYPISQTFEVIENISGGALSCTSSDEEVAICSIEGTTVTVTPGEKEGSATLTIKSEGNSKYKEAMAAYVARTEKGLLSYTANGYSGVYDGEEHGITVSSENAIIKYGLEEGSYTLDASPKYTDVGEYTVYFEITKAGFNTIRGSKTIVITKAEGKIELEETAGTIEYDKTGSVEIKENASNGEITVEVADQNVVEATIVDGKLNITGKKIGETTITLTSGETNNYNSASTKYTVTVTKANNTLKLSSNSGSYTYPEGGSFEVIENVSGGTLSCETSDKEVAECSIEGTKVTVTLGTKEGIATLTIKSAETENYKAGQVAYVVTTGNGLLSVTANGYSGVYDGKEHGITVTSSGATIKYGTTEGSYTLETSPTYTDVGEYTVYYQVTKTGYKTVTGSKIVVITKAEGSVVAPTAKTLTYTGIAQELVKAGSTSTGTIEYKLENGSYSTSIPTAINAGTYTVYYKVVGDKNHTDVEEKSITVTISKANNTLTLSSNSGNYTYPTSGTFEITENKSGGTLSCTSSNTSVASCKIEGVTVTVTPGTIAGSTTITIKSAATENYNSGQAAYLVVTANGLLSVTANGYSGEYDGEAHGITVISSGATIKYGTTEGSYTLETSPTYTDVGTYTVYYQVTKEGYTTVTGSKTVVITNLSASNVSYTNSSVSSITNVAEALDYLNEKLK